MRTILTQKFYDKINEQNKWWNVEVEFNVAVVVQPQTLQVHLEGAYENFGSKSVNFLPVQINMKGRKTLEIEALLESEVRKKFEDLNAGEGWEATLYIGNEFISDGFESRVEDADVKIVSIEESE